MREASMNLKHFREKTGHMFKIPFSGNPEVIDLVEVKKYVKMKDR